MVTLFKDNLTEEQLTKLGLNDRPIKTILSMKSNEKITNSNYQALNNVSKATATRDLLELVEKYKILKRTGDIGVGTYYELIGSNRS